MGTVPQPSNILGTFPSHYDSLGTLGNSIGTYWNCWDPSGTINNHSGTLRELWDALGPLGTSWETCPVDTLASQCKRVQFLGRGIGLSILSQLGQAISGPRNDAVTLSFYNVGDKVNKSLC